MISLVFASPALRNLRDSLANPTLESAAILLCVPVRLQNADGWRLLVREAHVAGAGDYLRRTALAVELDPAFCLPLERRARDNNFSLVYVHTHPFASEAEFSHIDDATEAAMSGYLEGRFPGRPHISLLFSKARVAARMVGCKTPVRVMEAGADLAFAYDPREEMPLEERFDRQIRAFGPEGQARLSTLTIAIVGLGGTGSQICCQLAHLGIHKFILIDDDVIEATNLNRVVGSLETDAGHTLKVDAAERMIRGINSAASVRKIATDVTVRGIARQAIEADVIFNCTDTHGSRHVLNQASYQFGVPVFDMGVSITVDASMNARLAGHVKMIGNDLPCLWCSNHLDPEQVTIELMSHEQRLANPYFQGAGAVPQPAVISLNGVVSAASVTMMLAAVVGVPSKPRYITYDGNRARMNELADQREPNCVYCGPQSTAFWGDVYDLPGKAS